MSKQEMARRVKATYGRPPRECDILTFGPWWAFEGGSFVFEAPGTDFEAGIDTDKVECERRFQSDEPITDGPALVEAVARIASNAKGVRRG